LYHPFPVLPHDPYFRPRGPKIHTHIHQFNGPLSGTTQVSWYQKSKTNLDLLEQETVSGSGIICAICKSDPHPRHITLPAPQHSVFYRPDSLPATQPTASKHYKQQEFLKIHANINYPMYVNCQNFCIC